MDQRRGPPFLQLSSFTPALLPACALRPAHWFRPSAQRNPQSELCSHVMSAPTFFVLAVPSGPRAADLQRSNRPPFDEQSQVRRPRIQWPHPSWMADGMRWHGLACQMHAVPATARSPTRCKDGRAPKPSRGASASVLAAVEPFFDVANFSGAIICCSTVLSCRPSIPDRPRGGGKRGSQNHPTPSAVFVR